MLVAGLIDICDGIPHARRSGEVGVYSHLYIYIYIYIYILVYTNYERQFYSRWTLSGLYSSASCSSIHIQNSVDNFYFYKAYCIIKRWFIKFPDKKEHLQNNLINHTKVIWYQENQATENSSKTFVNFNDGKISLDQAELIKGLFVLNFNNISDTTQKAYEENQFADEWNNIEQHLKEPSFWNFINAEKITVPKNYTAPGVCL